MSVFLWLDLETTGLDEDTCQIIEVAAIVTGPAFEPLEEYTAVVNPGAVSYEKGAIGFHKSSGLYNEVKDGISLAEAEADLLQLMYRYEKNKRRIKLAGNSVHFDRRFLKKYMPAVVDHLSNRHLDVSAVGVLMRSLYGDQAEFKAHRPHRALPDLHRSLAELSFYRESFLKI